MNSAPVLAAVVPAVREVGPITRTDIVRFAGASGDFNPIHHDEEFARAAGYPTVFAMGMFTAGLLGDYVAGWLGFESIRRFKVRFVSPTWPADRLMLTAASVGSPDDLPMAELVVRAGDKVRLTGAVGTGEDGGETVPDTSEDLRGLIDIPATDMTLPVERGKVMEFARAIKSTNPLHFDAGVARSAGFADVLAPLTFSAAAAHYNGGDAADLPRRLGLELARVVHGEQRWTFRRPLVAGETLSGTRRVAAAWRKPARSGGAMTFVLVAIDYRDEAGEPVLRDEMLIIERPPRPKETGS
jgi:acyl dehydratase